MVDPGSIRGRRPGGWRGSRILLSPATRLTPITLLDRGDVTLHARALVASLPDSIGYRELAIVRERFALDRADCVLEHVRNSAGPGNVLMVEARSADITEVMTAFGVKGVRAEEVAKTVADEVDSYLAVNMTRERAGTWTVTVGETVK